MISEFADFWRSTPFYMYFIYYFFLMYRISKKSMQSRQVDSRRIIYKYFRVV